LSIFEVYDSEDDVEVAESLKNVGNTYRVMGDFKKALKYFIESFDIYKRVLDAEDMVTHDAQIKSLLKSIIECYNKTSDMANAGLYQKKLYNFEKKNYSLACVVS
jgi:hypothetical protein